MDHKEYTFVDVALGDVTKRNNISDLRSLQIPTRKANCYTTYFRFRKEYAEHVIATGTVRGADRFSCWSDFLWFDIDGEILTDALVNVKKLLTGLQTLGILDHTVVFFSGAKGFHVGINAGLFGFEPSVQLPQQMRQTAERIASIFSVDIDTVVYNHNRLWRIPGTVHGKTKLRKTLLCVDDLLELTDGDQLLSLVKKAPKIASAYWVCDAEKPLSALEEFVEPVKPPVKTENQWFDPGPTDRQLDEMNVALELLLKQGEPEGSLDSGAILRASECRKVGNSQDDTLELIQKWNESNEPPLEEDDLSRVVKSAFKGDGYDFGTKSSDPLCEARTRARELVNEHQNDEDDEDDDGDSRDLRPRTLTELLADPDIGKVPETVGEWISWRGCLSLLVGAPKTSGKSTLCTYEAKAALQKGGRVLWITNDEPVGFVVRRFVEAGLTDDEQGRLFVSAGTVFPSIWKQVMWQIDQVEPDLVILDSLHSVLLVLSGKGKLPEQSETAEWQSLLTKLRPLAIESNFAVVWIHHANKTGVSAGSVGITAAADVIIDLAQNSAVRDPTRRDLNFLGRLSASHDLQLRFEGADKGYSKVNLSTTNTKESKKRALKTAMETWLIEKFSSQAQNDYTISGKTIKREALEMFTKDFSSERTLLDELYDCAKAARISFAKHSGMWTMLNPDQPNTETDDGSEEEE